MHRQFAGITLVELLTEAAQRSSEVTSLSGDCSWKNNVLGLSLLPLEGESNGKLSALLTANVR